MYVVKPFEYLKTDPRQLESSTARFSCKVRCIFQLRHLTADKLGPHAGRRALSLWSEVEEHHALFGEGIDTRSSSATERTAVVRTEFAHAEIVNEEINDVWFLASRCGRILRWVAHHCVSISSYEGIRDDLL
jgi:hypothetical protein